MNGKTESPVLNAPLIRAGIGLAVAAALLVLGLALVHTLFVVPSFDDFHNRTYARDWGFAKSLRFYWETASGRVASLSLAILLYRWVDFLTPAHALVLGFFVLLLFAACVLYVSVIFDSPILDRASMLLGLLLFAAYWAVMPSPGESFYWIPDVAQNHAAIFLFAVLLVLLQPSRGIHGRVRGPVTFLLAFVFSLMHEWVTLLGGFAILLLGLWAIFRGDRGARYYLAVLPAMAAGLAITMLAPGVGVRIGRVERGPFAIETINAAFESFIFRTIHWMGSPAYLALIGLIILLAPSLWRRRQTGNLDNSRNRQALMFAPALLTGLFLGFLGYKVAAGATTPFASRILNTLYLILLGGSVGIASRLAIPRRAVTPVILFMAGLAYAAAVLLSPNTVTAVRDLRDGTTRAYRHDYEKLHRELLSRKGSHAVLETYPRTPGVFRFSMISSDPNYWVNRRMADYYGLKSLIYADGPGLDATGQLVLQPPDGKR